MRIVKAEPKFVEHTIVITNQEELDQLRAVCNLSAVCDACPMFDDMGEDVGVFENPDTKYDEQLTESMANYYGKKPKGIARGTKAKGGKK